ncbi:MAG: AEC family transporter [Chloroflexi bacterium]|nr:AEC family transporter [Chloroflexota bacterium]
MSEITDVLVNNILPIFIVAAIGFALRQSLGLDVKTVARVTFNGFSPCLVFYSLVTAKLNGGELLLLGGYSLLTILLMGLLGWLVGRLFRLSRLDTVALVLALMFVNSGNYGLTLLELRYGDEGVVRGIAYFVVSTILAYSVGILVASAGQRTVRQALAQLVRVPAVYAVVLALLVYGFDLTVPAPLLKGIQIAAEGSIPVMLLVLGMQLADLRAMEGLKVAWLATGLRLVVAPLMALWLADRMHLEGLNRSAMLLEASMPTAVLVTVLATEYDVRPRLLTTIVVLSTLLSPFSLAVFITWAGL